MALVKKTAPAAATAKAAPKTGTTAGKPAPGKAVAKVAAKVPAKKGAKKIAVKAAKTLKKGGAAWFIKNANDDEPSKFEPGDKLFIGDVIEEDGVQTFACCLYDEKDNKKAHGEQLLAAEISPVKPTKDQLPEVKIEVKDIGELAKLRKKAGDNIVGAINDLYENVQRSYLNMGGLLAHVYHDGVYVEEGYEKGKEGFSKFVEERLKCGARKAFDLIHVYMRLSNVKDLDFAQIERIGYAKMAIAAGAITDENVSEVLELAEETAASELRDAINNAYERSTGGGGGGARVKRTTYRFKLFEDQAEGVNFVLDKAQKQLGLPSPDATFEHIVMTFARDNLKDVATKAASAVVKKQKALKAKGLTVPGTAVVPAKKGIVKAKAA